MANVDMVQELAEVIRLRLGLGQKPVLLVGAGCSVTAGIPAADEMVTYVKENMPAMFRAAQGDTYADCMQAMLDGVRRDLIAHFVHNSKPNPAHVSIARLVKAGMVDSILTTNFDPLLKVACNDASARTVSLDLTLPSQVMPQGTTETPIYFLHGRHTGRVLLITKENFDTCDRDIKENTGHLFRNAGRRGPWIVCGYSGRNDPLLKLITQIKQYEYGLYWVLYKGDELPPSVGRVNGLRVVEEHNADTFFETLAKSLDPVGQKGREAERQRTAVQGSEKLKLLRKPPLKE